MTSGFQGKGYACRLEFSLHEPRCRQSNEGTQTLQVSLCWVYLISIQLCLLKEKEITHVKPCYLPRRQRAGSPRAHPHYLRRNQPLVCRVERAHPPPASTARARRHPQTPY